MIYLLTARHTDLYGEKEDEYITVGYTNDFDTALKWKRASPGYTEHRDFKKIDVYTGD